MRKVIRPLVTMLSALAVPQLAHATNPTLDVELGVNETAIHGYTYLDSYTLHGCSGNTWTHSVDGNVDLAAGFYQTVPAGVWCSADFAFDDQIELVYNGPNGPWSDQVELGTISIALHPVEGSGMPPVLHGVYGGNPTIVSDLTP